MMLPFSSCDEIIQGLRFVVQLRLRALKDPPTTTGKPRRQVLQGLQSRTQQQQKIWETDLRLRCL
ncbi:MAG: hypothetical protein DRJ65_07925 [Acidobacteria bacterium]|nr:MAG: hypothetical protein DRJ65_07925 [Acidobacteriota bacterium]